MEKEYYVKVADFRSIARVAPPTCLSDQSKQSLPPFHTLLSCFSYFLRFYYYANAHFQSLMTNSVEDCLTSERLAALRSADAPSERKLAELEHIRRSLDKRFAFPELSADAKKVCIYTTAAILGMSRSLKAQGAGMSRMEEEKHVKTDIRRASMSG